MDWRDHGDGLQLTNLNEGFSMVKKNVPCFILSSQLVLLNYELGSYFLTNLDTYIRRNGYVCYFVYWGTVKIGKLFTQRYSKGRCKDEGYQIF